MNDVVSGPNGYQLKKVRLAASLTGRSLKTNFETDRVILTISGIEVAGANAAIRALAKLCSDPSLDLFGKGFAEYVKVEEMIDWMAMELEPYLDIWLQSRANRKISPEILDEINKDLKEKLDMLESKLQRGLFVVGNQLTLADVCVISALFEPLELAGQKMLPKNSKIFDYVQNLAKNAKVKSVFGQFGSGPSLSPIHDKHVQLHGKVDDLRPHLASGDISKVMSQLKNFSLWLVRYRYTEYNVINTVSERKMQKFKDMLTQTGGVCGSLSVNGDAPFEISGALIYEGSDLPAHLAVKKDSQFYTYEKLSNREKWLSWFEGDLVEDKAVKKRIYL